MRGRNSHHYQTTKLLSTIAPTCTLKISLCLKSHGVSQDPANIAMGGPFCNGQTLQVPAPLTHGDFLAQTHISPVPTDTQGSKWTMIQAIAVTFLIFFLQQLQSKYSG